VVLMNEPKVYQKMSVSELEKELRTLETKLTIAAERVKTIVVERNFVEDELEKRRVKI